MGSREVVGKRVDEKVGGYLWTLGNKGVCVEVFVRERGRR